MKFFEHLKGFVEGKKILAKEILNLFLLEFKLAKLNIIILFILVAGSFILALSSWLLIVAISILLLMYYFNLIICLTTVLIFNILLLFVVSRIIKNCVKNISFIKTREMVGLKTATNSLSKV